MTILTIRVELAILESALHPLDIDVVGEYIEEVDSAIPVGTAVGIALDRFHSSVPIKTFDDFSIHVFDQGVEVFEASDYISYSAT